MRMNIPCLAGNVLPTAVAATLVIAAGTLGLIMIRELELAHDRRTERMRQARADAESALTLYLLHPDDERITSPDGYRLYDSVPKSKVYVAAEPWGLYEIVTIATADSLARSCRLAGAEPDAETSLYYADGGAALNIAGGTRLRGLLHLPRNGLVYGRAESEFRSDETVPPSAIRLSEAAMPAPDTAAETRMRMRRRFAEPDGLTALPADAHVPFSGGATMRISLGNATIADCDLAGRISIEADEIRIDSTCRMRNVTIYARNATIGAGARITAQIIVRDSVTIEKRAAMTYPSGIWAGRYAELQDDAAIDGYAIVCDTVHGTPTAPAYRQAPSAKMRGLLYVDGTADVQGTVTGYACLREAARFTPQGYYKDMLYGVRLRPNAATALPLWIAGGKARRKEAACVD